MIRAQTESQLVQILGYRHFGKAGGCSAGSGVFKTVYEKTHERQAVYIARQDRPFNENYYLEMFLSIVKALSRLQETGFALETIRVDQIVRVGEQVKTLVSLEQDTCLEKHCHSA